jgi:hypothetical protein
LTPQRIERTTGLPLRGETDGCVENENNQNRYRFSAVAGRPGDNGSDCEQGNHDARELIDEHTPGGTRSNPLKSIGTVSKLSLGYF